MTLHPLFFQPIFKPKLWGGRGLEQHFGKALPPNEPIGESWELSDLESDPSVVRLGPSAGRTLRELLDQWGPDLMGRVPLYAGRFPLLIKFLDAVNTLSVQVHPRSSSASLDHAAKHEAWFVVRSDPGGFIYRGFKPGVDRRTFVEAVSENRVVELLQRIRVRAGDAFYLPSGTVHALGAGVMVAEVQTPVDVTFRVHDFHRTDPATGRERELHVQEALDHLNFSEGPMAGEERSHLASVWTTVTRLITHETFIIERVRMVEGATLPIAYGGPVVWIVLEGRGDITSDAFDRFTYSFGAGDVLLLPAALRDAVFHARTPCTWLEVTLPIASDLADYPRLSSAALAAPTADRVTLGLPRPAPKPEA